MKKGEREREIKKKREKKEKNEILNKLKKYMHKKIHCYIFAATCSDI